MEVIELDRFINIRNLNRDCTVQLRNKAQELFENYKCFRENEYTSIKKWKNTSKIEAKSRPKIGVKEISIEMMGKKEFLSLMNKLSDKNKNSLIKNFIVRDSCVKIYVSISWDMMLRSPEYQNIYFDLLNYIKDKIKDSSLLFNELNKICEDTVIEKKWLPPENTLEDNDYDEFCDFVKWKKRIISTSKAFVMLTNRGWIEYKSIVGPLITNILDELNILLKSGGCKITDSLLEQLLILIDIIQSQQEDHIIEFMKVWIPMSDTLKPSTKFKLLDLKDIFERKMKNLFRVHKKHGL